MSEIRGGMFRTEPDVSTFGLDDMLRCCVWEFLKATFLLSSPTTGPRRGSVRVDDESLGISQDGDGEFAI